MSESCGSCRYFGLQEGEVIVQGGLYHCHFPVPPLPIAFIRTRGMVSDTDGSDCPCWTGAAPRPWRAVMEWPADWEAVTEDRVKSLYLRLRSIRHPDNKLTGSREAMAELDRALDAALKEIF